MSIEVIPLSRLERDLRAMVNECADSGRPIVVELPDGRLVAIQGLEPFEHDELTSELLETNPDFQSLVARSAASRRMPFAP